MDEARDRAGHISSKKMLGDSPSLGPCNRAEMYTCLKFLGLYLNHTLIQSLR